MLESYFYGTVVYGEIEKYKTLETRTKFLRITKTGAFSMIILIWIMKTCRMDLWFNVFLFIYCSPTYTQPV